MPPGYVVQQDTNSDTWDTRTSGGKNIRTTSNKPRYVPWLSKTHDIDPFTRESRPKDHAEDSASQLEAPPTEYEHTENTECPTCPRDISNEEILAGRKKTAHESVLRETIKNTPKERP